MPAKPGTVLIRADANVSIGTGHVMRCLALAQAWQDRGGSAVFLATEMPKGLETRLAGRNIGHARSSFTPGSAEDAAATLDEAHRRNAKWIVVDGDRFRSEFLDQISGGGCRVLLIDDFADRDHFAADLIVNPNLGADPGCYGARAPQGQVFCGPRYALLGSEFSVARARQFKDRANKVLITLGGSDPENLTPPMVSALARSAELQITVVIGAANSKNAGLPRKNEGGVRVVIDAQNMADLMSDADLAVIAAGGTLWELLSMGCAVLSYARNAVQMRVVQQLAKDGVVVNLGDTAHFDPATLASEVSRVADSRSRREQMAAQGHKLVDGRGAARIAEAMQNREVH